MATRSISFASNTTALQGNYIVLQFDGAIDKTIYDLSVLSYQYRYGYAPIYCNTSSATSDYAYWDDNEVTYSSWTALTGYSYNPDTQQVTASIVVPSFSSDMEIVFQVRAVDDANQGYSGALETTPCAFFYNAAPQLSIYNANWGATVGGDQDKRNINVIVNIGDLGLFKPANSAQIAVTEETSWSNYRDALRQSFGDISYVFSYFFSSTNTRPSSPQAEVRTFIVAQDEAENAYDWIADPNITLTLPYDEANPWSTDNSYYVWIGMNVESSATNIRINGQWDGSADRTTFTQYQLVQSLTPVMQIKKNALKIHMGRTDSFATGGGMFNHNGMVTDGQSPSGMATGHSIALYDTHVKEGASDATNEPSVGFFNSGHKELARIQARKLDGFDALTQVLPNGNQLSLRMREGVAINDADILEFYDWGTGTETGSWKSLAGLIFENIETQLEDLKTSLTTSILDSAHPVGSLYITTTATNPATYFGGTWEKYSEGRLLMGVGTTEDAEGYSRTISAGEESGYWKIRNVQHTHTFNHTHSDTFSVASGGSHSHTMNHTHSDNFSIASAGAHTHSIADRKSVNGTEAGNIFVESWPNGSNPRNMKTGSAGSHTHTLNGGVSTYSGSTSSASSHSHTLNGSVSTYSGSTSSTGVTATTSSSGISSSNLYNTPPYVGVYVWKRTA